MKTSENFRREFKAGNYAKALQLALAEAIELEITTWVVDADSSNADTPPEPQPGNRIVTKINIVDGNIQNEVGSAYLKDGPYGELWNFHRGQVEKGREIISKNLQDLQSLFTALTTVLSNKAGASATDPVRTDALPAPPVPEPDAGIAFGQALEPDAIDISSQPTPDLFVAEVDLAAIEAPEMAAATETEFNFASEIAPSGSTDVDSFLFTDLPASSTDLGETGNVTQPPIDDFEGESIASLETAPEGLDLFEETEQASMTEAPIAEAPIAEASIDDLLFDPSESIVMAEGVSLLEDPSALDDLSLEGIEPTTVIEPLDEADADLLLDLSDLEQLDEADALILEESNFPPEDEDEPPTDPFADRSIGSTQAEASVMPDLLLNRLDDDLNDLEASTVEDSISEELLSEEPLSEDELLLLDDAIVSEEDNSDDMASFDPEALDWNSNRGASEQPLEMADLDAFADLNSSDEWDSLDETFGSLEEAHPEGSASLRALPDEVGTDDPLFQALTEIETVEVISLDDLEADALEADDLEAIGLEESDLAEDLEDSLFNDPDLLFSESQTVITLDEDVSPEPDLSLSSESLLPEQTSTDLSDFNDDDDLSALFGTSSINGDEDDLLPGTDFTESAIASSEELLPGTDFDQPEESPLESIDTDFGNLNDDDDLSALFEESESEVSTVAEPISSALPDLDDDALNALFGNGEEDSSLFAALSAEETPSDSSIEGFSEFDLDEDNPFADADFLAELGDSEFDTSIEEPSSINPNASEPKPSSPAQFPPPPPPPSWRRPPQDPSTDR